MALLAGLWSGVRGCTALLGFSEGHRVPASFVQIVVFYCKSQRLCWGDGVCTPRAVCPPTGPRGWGPHIWRLVSFRSWLRALPRNPDLVTWESVAFGGRAYSSEGQGTRYPCVCAPLWPPGRHSRAWGADPRLGKALLGGFSWKTRRNKRACSSMEGNSSRTLWEDEP